MVARNEVSTFAARVAAAFSATQDTAMGRDSLRRPRWFDEAGHMHYYADEVSERVASFLEGQRWTQLVGTSFSSWRERTEAPRLLSPYGLFLILPPYLINSENAVRSESGHDISETAYTLIPLVTRLTRPSTPGSAYQQAFSRSTSAAQRDAMMRQNEAEFDEFVSYLNRAQRDVICEFLVANEEFFAEDEVNMASLALEVYR